MLQIDTILALIGVVLGSSVLSAFVSEGIKYLNSRKTHKENVEDKNLENKIESIQGQVTALKTEMEEIKQNIADNKAEQDSSRRDMNNALCMIMLDRIRYVGKTYISKGYTDFDERRILHKMHDAYHKIGGNGDLDTLMEEVENLPLEEAYKKEDRQ